eukprot:m.522988 g.522988  ORF g.522988 m.522988 type:complete len:352 (+) comp21973_c0_seq5:64-1119(+)
MCGIFAVLGAGNPEGLRTWAIAASKTLRHRGPDWSGYRVLGVNAFCHERLAIVDPVSGSQPLVSPDDTLTLCVNGEIYNHQEIRDDPEYSDYEFTTKSDCEVILALYQKHARKNASCSSGVDDPAKHNMWINKLRGMFAFVLHDASTGEYIAVRDHVGICPLYIGYGADGSISFASEFKALTDKCARFENFPPGQYYQGGTGKFHRWYTPKWVNRELIPSGTLDLTELREQFEAAVVRRLMSDVPWGVLLSGGLDSSLVASICARHAAARIETGGSEQACIVGYYPRSCRISDEALYLGDNRIVSLSFLFKIQYYNAVWSECYQPSNFASLIPMELLRIPRKNHGVPLVNS